ncbi:mono/diheme cytochrome c family protein/glucose/arabinose dehydrogenase/lysophospholipase L1-like esterase [Lewinella marina]|uniref:Dehydrogenase n=1 Tax=Neolewinella marina TaxID=438751 RepID=A0A2G0CC36_9BACT|nr:PVC-type heme-binding CxxCH protein [Neolewinella marina]NJB86718.1 mono/diheme cytochrome c family protein/glucose/arabinose dehydrogenase/lysophospholipase L1-like esterase [Neolewinella marina]PHK97525.1 dehydrogenase [Neolewinella marina]
MTKLFFLPLLACLLAGCASRDSEGILDLQPEDHIVLIGNNLCSRMSEFGHFETAIYQTHPTAELTVRNMCDPGNTAGFRPHASRNSPWAFPGAEAFNPDVSRDSHSEGFFPSEDEWLDSLDADVVIAFFGLNESYGGAAGLTNFALELDSFLRHSQQQRYNDESAPRLVLVSPLAYENSSDLGLPDGTSENENIARYTQAMADIAADNGVPFVDLFSVSREWMEEGERLTTDGISLSDAGYRRLAGYLTEQLFGEAPPEEDPDLLARVKDKNHFWLLDFKMPNGVHAYGRRYNPYGPDNYPYEKEKVKQLTANRDAAIHAYLRGEDYDLAAADALTRPLPPVETNYAVEPADSVEYLYGEDALTTFTTAPGFQIDLFASEREFPELANPTQMNWDDQGRLWVSLMPSYPHYKPGDELPNDKLVILEDTDGDGRADELKVWADNLHLPVGFEFANGGVYVSQGTDLVFLKDTDGDDRADYRETVMSGFDDHDTHHNISAYEADPGGGIYMGEGVFLHTNVETPYGPVRATNGGFYRFNPARRHLERTAQISIPNPWGIIFDAWGQPIFAHTSGPRVQWMLPSTIKNLYGVQNPMAPDLIEPEHRVRPTSGLEIISSRHFPEEMQGDLLINNTIGFLGTKQHRVFDHGAGFDTRWRQDLVTSTDPNFRPVDMEFAPDGSLYLVDWHNVLVGHMQHNARDPLRDHVHGRIYRITYPGRPLVKAPKVADATIPQLLENLKEPEYRTRYRSRRVLRQRDPKAVMAAVRQWVDQLDPQSENYPEYLREALFVTWGANMVDRDILDAASQSNDFRLRAAAARVVRYLGHLLEDETRRLTAFAADPHPRVRMEAMTAASWLPREEGEKVLAEAERQKLDEFDREVLLNARAHLSNKAYIAPAANIVEAPDSPIARAYALGAELFEQEGYCGTCHQQDGRGLAATGYPPLAGSPWVTGSKERLIKLVMHGLYGPMEVKGKQYDGQVPMTAYGGLMDDEEMAAVLTYVRNAFGNEAPMVKPEEIAAVRTATAGRKGMYEAAELLREHPFPEEVKK